MRRLEGGAAVAASGSGQQGGAAGGGGEQQRQQQQEGKPQGGPTPEGRPRQAGSGGAAEDDVADQQLAEAERRLEAARRELVAAEAAVAEARRRKERERQQARRRQREQQQQQVADGRGGRPLEKHTITARLKGPGGRLLPDAREMPLVVQIFRKGGEGGLGARIRVGPRCAALRAQALTAEAAPVALTRGCCLIGLQVGALLAMQQAGQALPEGRELPLTAEGAAKLQPGWRVVCSDRGAGCMEGQGSG